MAVEGLRTASLETIGYVTIGLSDSEDASKRALLREYVRELARRVEQSRTKAKALYEFHAAAFARQSSPKHFCELFAMMLVHQALSTGGTLHSESVV